ncbi:MAG: PspA/IM30 family protein [Pseudomonadota bacterium]
MGFFSKLRTLLSSNINEMISRSEDPEKMLNQVTIDMKKQLGEAKKQVAASIADEKRLRKQYEVELDKGNDWEHRAIIAVRAEDDNLAREALVRKHEHDEAAVGLGQQWELQKQAVERLKDELRGLNNKIEEAKRKKGILIARKKRVEAQKSIHDTMSGLSDTSAFETFNRMVSKIDQLEAEAEAGVEMAGELSGEALDQKFQKLEVSASTDHALLELKEKMRLLPKSAGSEKGKLLIGNKETKVDEELAALKAKLASEPKSE